MRLTDQSQRAVMVASDMAHALGAEQVDTVHLLLGLTEAEGGARHTLGLDAEALRTAGAARFPPRPPHPDDVRVAFAAELKAAIEDSTRHAQANGRDFVTTTDLLAALLEVEEGPAVLVLCAAGGEPAVLRAALAAQDHGACCGETAVSFVRLGLAEFGARANAVPRYAWLVSLSAALALWSLLYAALVAITWDTAGPELVLTMAAGSIAIPLLVGPLRVLGQVRQLTARSLTVVPLPDDAGPLLDRLGVRRLEVHIQPGFGTDRCYRVGRRALIFLSAHTERDPERARFVLWHEIAHLARRDHLVWTVAGLLGAGPW